MSTSTSTSPSTSTIALTGSGKQIAWAERIRGVLPLWRAFADALRTDAPAAAIRAQQALFGMVAGDYLRAAGDLDELTASQREAVVAEVVAVVESWETETEASNWIEFGRTINGLALNGPEENDVPLQRLYRRYTSAQREC